MQIFRVRYELVNGLHDVLVPAVSEAGAIELVRRHLRLPDNEDRSIRIVEILGKLDNHVYAMPIIGITYAKGIQ